VAILAVLFGNRAETERLIYEQGKKVLLAGLALMSA